MSIKDEILSSLNTLYGDGDIIEIRIMQKFGTTSGYYDYEHFEKCASDVAKYDELTGVPAIYFTVNVVKRELTARALNRLEDKAKFATGEGDISRRVYLPIDIDPVRPSNTSSTDELHDASIKKAYEVKEWLINQSIPDMLIADSGNGAHLLIRIDQPNTPEVKTLIENVQKAIIQKFNMPKVDNIDIQGFADANRIWKLYGTKTRKGDEVPDLNIRHRRSKILYVPENFETATTAQLEAIANTGKDDKAAPQSVNAPNTTQYAGGKFDLTGFMVKHNIAVETTIPQPDKHRVMYRLVECVFNPDHKGRDSAIFQNDDGSLGFHCLHHSCADKQWSDVREYFEPNYKKYVPTVAQPIDINKEKESILNDIIAEMRKLEHSDNLVVQKHRLTDFLNQYCSYMNIGDLETFIYSTCKEEFGFKKNTDLVSIVREFKEKAKKNKQLIDEQNEFNKVLFSEVGDEIIKNEHMFVMVDSNEFYRYREGIYVNEGTKALPINTIIRNVYRTMIEARNEGKTHEIGNNQISEVRNYLMSYIHKERSIINNNVDEIAVVNGVLNTSTGVLTSHTPEKYITQKLNITYDTTAPCDIFDKFLREIFEGTIDHTTDECIQTVYEWFGYCLLKKYPLNKALMCVGEGGNGKGTLLRILGKFLGSENVSGMHLDEIADSVTFRFRIAGLYGKFANICGDLGNRTILNTEGFKKATGEDMLDVDIKNGNTPLRFFNHAKMSFGINEMPIVHDTSNGWFRRWVILKFPNRFYGQKDDTSLMEKCTTDAELSGILNKSLAGLKRIIDNNEFTIHDDIYSVRKTWGELSDVVGGFVQNCIYDEKGLKVTKAAVFNEYLNYCKANNLPLKADIVFHKEFKKAMKSHGVQYKETSIRIPGETKRVSHYVDIGVESIASLENDVRKLTHAIISHKNLYHPNGIIPDFKQFATVVKNGNKLVNTDVKVIEDLAKKLSKNGW